jgi:hypothetical protein
VTKQSKILAHLVFLISLPTDELLGDQLANERCHGVEFVYSSRQKRCIALGLQFRIAIGRFMVECPGSGVCVCECACLLFKRKVFMKKVRDEKRAARVSSWGGLSHWIKEAGQRVWRYQGSALAIAGV